MLCCTHRAAQHGVLPKQSFGCGLLSCGLLHNTAHTNQRKKHRAVLPGECSVALLTRGILFGIGTVVELGELDGMDLDEVNEFKMQDQLFVGIRLASQAGIPDH